MKKILTMIMLMATLSASAQINGDAEKLLNAQYAISNFYVDKPDDSKLTEAAIKAMLETLDPHSAYTDARETRELEEPLEGEFSGIGIQFNMKQDTLYVIQTIAGGPSEKVGIRAGDRIVTVNDTVIAGKKMRNTDIMKRLRGKKGTKVTVQVKRRGTPELITFRITRDKIPLHSVDAVYMLDEQVGYMSISNFGAKTYDEMIEGLDYLKARGMMALVLDLSSNGGGYLNAAIDMCDEFLGENCLIVYTEGRAQPRNEARATGRGHYRTLPLVVIVNQYSASAAEIFAGAMQDWDRAVIVGRRSFGKGLVQRPFRFQDGSMMRLTVARYYTPSGRCIQKEYAPGDKKRYEHDIVDREKSGEYFHADSILRVDSLRVATLRNGRDIYGGGGIIPDVFVPLDTTHYTTYYRDLVAKGIVSQWAVSHVDAHRAEIKKRYPTVNDFDRGFTLSDADIKSFIAMGERDSVRYDERMFRTSEPMLRAMLKALIARDVYTDRGAYTVVINHLNPDVHRALEVISDPKQYLGILGFYRPEGNVGVDIDKPREEIIIEENVIKP